MCPQESGNPLAASALVAWEDLLSISLAAFLLGLQAVSLHVFCKLLFFEKIRKRGTLLQIIAFLKDRIKQRELLLLTCELHAKFCIVLRGSAGRSVCKAAELCLRAGGTKGSAV